MVKVKVRQVFRATLIVSLVSLMTSCITESSGGMPGPAPDTERVSAQLDLARAYLEARDFERAKPPLDRALQIDSNNVEAHVLVAVLMQAQNEPELAEDHFRQALKVSPAHSQALNNYASFLYSRGRFEEAVVPLEKLVRDTSYRARSQAFESLGLSYLQVGDTQEAAAAFRRAVQLNLRLPRSNLELAHLAFDAGDYKTAQTQFDFFSRVAKHNARSLCLGLKLADQQGDSDQQARFSLALNNLFPDDAGKCQI